MTVAAKTAVTESVTAVLPGQAVYVLDIGEFTADGTVPDDLTPVAARALAEELGPRLRRGVALLRLLEARAAE